MEDSPSPLMSVSSMISTPSFRRELDTFLKIPFLTQASIDHFLGSGEYWCLSAQEALTLQPRPLLSIPETLYHPHTVATVTPSITLTRDCSVVHFKDTRPTATQPDYLCVVEPEIVLTEADLDVRREADLLEAELQAKDRAAKALAAKKLKSAPKTPTNTKEGGSSSTNPRTPPQSRGRKQVQSSPTASTIVNTTPTQVKDGAPSGAVGGLTKSGSFGSGKKLIPPPPDAPPSPAAPPPAHIAAGALNSTPPTLFPRMFEEGGDEYTPKLFKLAKDFSMSFGPPTYPAHQTTPPLQHSHQTTPVVDTTQGSSTPTPHTAEEPEPVVVVETSMLTPPQALEEEEEVQFIQETPDKHEVGVYTSVVSSECEGTTPVTEGQESSPPVVPQIVLLDADHSNTTNKPHVTLIQEVVKPPPPTALPSAREKNDTTLNSTVKSNTTPATVAIPHISRTTSSNPKCGCQCSIM